MRLMEQKEGLEKKFTQADMNEIIRKRLERERKKAEKKLKMLDLKVLCYNHDIAKDYSEEAIALARLYTDKNTDMDKALEKVIKKFPMFIKGTRTMNANGEEILHIINSKAANAAYITVNLLASKSEMD